MNAVLSLVYIRWLFILFLVRKGFYDNRRSQPNWWRNRRHQRQAQCSYSVDLSRKTLARQLSGNLTNRKTVVEHPSKTSELPWDSHAAGTPCDSPMFIDITIPNKMYNYQGVVNYSPMQFTCLPTIVILPKQMQPCF